MKTAVKLFLWLNMLVAIAVVVMGVFLYQEHEIIKARTVLLEKNATRVAQNLNWGTAVDWEAADARKTSPFALPLINAPTDVEVFDKSLNELAALAEVRVKQLTDRYAELVQTQAVLRDTETRLATRIRELEDANREIVGLEQTLATTQNELRQANSSVSDLEREKSGLEQTISSLSTQLEELNAKSTVLGDSITKTEGEYQRAMILLRSCLYPPRPEDKTANEWTDVPAKVLAVDREWNLAIINKGEVDTLPMFIEAYVHRGDTFIGKLRIMRVENTVAIAEILQNTLVDGATIEVGDTIFF